MAKLEEPQNIPSELLDLYRGTLNPHPTGHIVKKRYPFRMPRMQEGGKGVHSGQKAQRARFKTAMADFRNVSAPDRARWYAAEPPWSSFLWYYNYFIMSSLAGNADISQGGAGVIKSIQVMKASCPTTGEHAFTLGTQVDADKTTVIINGSARKVPRVIRGYGGVAPTGNFLNLGTTVDPDKCTTKLFGTSVIDGGGAGAVAIAAIVENLTSDKIYLGWSQEPDAQGIVGWEVTEHVEGEVLPVLVSVSDTTVTVDWAEVPDAAADVSILVIEYI